MSRPMTEDILRGRPLSPHRMLGEETGDKDIRIATETRPWRHRFNTRGGIVTLVVALGIGVACATSYVAYLASATGDDASARVIRLAVTPVATLAAGGVAMLKTMSEDDEIGVRETLVIGDTHLVHVRSYATGTGGDSSEPVVHVIASCVTIGSGTAKRMPGGVLFSEVECHHVRILQADIGSVGTMSFDDASYEGTGEAFLPDAFTTPLSDVLGEWIESDDWCWGQDSGIPTPDADPSSADASS